MFSSQVQYGNYLESVRSNMANEHIKRGQLHEQIRNDKVQNRIARAQNREAKRSHLADEHIRRAQNHETVRHNKVGESISRYDSRTRRKDANTNRINSRTNARNADTNAFNARVNAQNANTNAFNAQTAWEDMNTRRLTFKRDAQQFKEELAAKKKIAGEKNEVDRYKANLNAETSRYVTRKRNRADFRRAALGEWGSTVRKDADIQNQNMRSELDRNAHIGTSIIGSASNFGGALVGGASKIAAAYG